MAPKKEHYFLSTFEVVNEWYECRVTSFQLTAVFTCPECRVTSFQLTAVFACPERH
jgi:hypothetical protein